MKILDVWEGDVCHALSFLLGRASSAPHTFWFTSAGFEIEVIRSSVDIWEYFIAALAESHKLPSFDSFIYC